MLRLGIDGARAKFLCEHKATVDLIRATDTGLQQSVKHRGGVLARRIADALGVTLPRAGGRAHVAADVAAASERIRRIRAALMQSRSLESRLSQDQVSRDTRSSA